MKQLIPILTAVIILLKPFWPLIEYSFNYEYIVSNLCENRDKPVLKCNGKCYLAKQIAAEPEESEKNPFNSKFFKLKLPIIDWFDIQKIDFQYFDFVLHIYTYTNKLNHNLFTLKNLKPPEFS